MFDNEHSQSAPLRKHILTGLVFCLIYALAAPVSDYFQHGELNWQGILWGIIAFLFSVGLALFILWHQKNELKQDRSQDDFNARK